ncbi:MAG: T9SS type A sorting domain-containing protein [Saprospiraceae bacterium]
MKFIFDEIMLPDSNVNEPASHGFVKFRIKQKRDLPLNTKIFNKAAIYFDYNEPIITNTTLHTITQYSGYVGTINHYGSESLPWVHVYPNPFFEKATFELKNVNGNEFQFQLLDVNGKLVSSSSFKGKTFQFNQENLPGGLYFYRIMNEGMDVYSGKIFLR